MLAERERMMPETNVELLRNISEPLRAELHAETFAPVLSVHPFFARLGDQCPQVMRRVCHLAVELQAVAAGDVIFHPAEVPERPKMYFIVDGEFKYRSMEGFPTVLGSGCWVSEAALWAGSWMHRGELSAATEARMAVLDARHFEEAVLQFEHLEVDPKTYATEFVEAMNRYDDLDLSDVPDIASRISCDTRIADATKSHAMARSGFQNAVLFFRRLASSKVQVRIEPQDETGWLSPVAGPGQQRSSSG